MLGICGKYRQVSQAQSGGSAKIRWSTRSIILHGLNYLACTEYSAALQQHVRYKRRVFCVSSKYDTASDSPTNTVVVSREREGRASSARLGPMYMAEHELGMPGSDKVIDNELILCASVDMTEVERREQIFSPRR